MTDGIVVTEVTVAEDATVREVVRLLGQLSSRPIATTTALVREAIASDATRLIVARDGDAVVGTLTLAMFSSPSGRRAWIEDVVVDEVARRRGVGEVLVRHAVTVATDAGARTVDLTSRSSRVEAHNLYRKVGFEVRETTVYRREIEGPAPA